MLLKNDCLGCVCINLQADIVGVASSFARICTSHLKQKAKIINRRWAGHFGKLLVCFAARVAFTTTVFLALVLLDYIQHALLKGLSTQVWHCARTDALPSID